MFICVVGEASYGKRAEPSAYQTLEEGRRTTAISVTSVCRASELYEILLYWRFSVWGSFAFCLGMIELSKSRGIQREIKSLLFLNLSCAGRLLSADNQPLSCWEAAAILCHPVEICLADPSGQTPWEKERLGVSFVCHTSDSRQLKALSVCMYWVPLESDSIHLLRSW